MKILRKETIGILAGLAEKSSQDIAERTLMLTDGI